MISRREETPVLSLDPKLHVSHKDFSQNTLETTKAEMAMRYL